MHVFEHMCKHAYRKTRPSAARRSASWRNALRSTDASAFGFGRKHELKRMCSSVRFADLHRVGSRCVESVCRVCLCVCMYRFKGLRPPAAGPLSWILTHRWMVTAGSGLLAGDCWLDIPCLWIARGKQEAGRGLLECSNRSPGWHRRDFEIASGSHGKTPGGSREGQRGPSDALSLRFPMLLGNRTL